MIPGDNKKQILVKYLVLVPVVNLEFLFREQVQLCSKETQLQPNKLKIKFSSVRLKRFHSIYGRWFEKSLNSGNRRIRERNRR